MFDQPENFDRFRPRLESYKYNSSQVQVEYIDAIKNPQLATQQKVDTIPTILIEYMGRTERVSTDSEQDLTNAVIKLLNPTARKVYFLSGHGEKDPANSERTGYSGIADALKRDNYQFDKLVLAQTNEIPADATMIVVAGPRTDLLEQEVPILEEYLTKKTGKLLVMLDPSENFKQPSPMPRLTGLLKQWGINATESVVVDLSGRTQVATVPVSAPPYPSHAHYRRVQPRHDVPARARDNTSYRRATESHRDNRSSRRQHASWAETNLPSLEDPSKLARGTGEGRPGGASLDWRRHGRTCTVA